MTDLIDGRISVVIPVYNEAVNLVEFNDSLLNVLKKLPIKDYEIIYCDDGSIDNSNLIISKLIKDNSNTKLIRLSRNFGKEYALSAGIINANGDAIITLDADGQHPVELIPKFIESWQSGSQVVVGVRDEDSAVGLSKKLGSKIFYYVFNHSTGQKMLPGSTDFRLITKDVQQEFIKLNETDRITRGLIDWLGFKRDKILFKAKPRLHGQATYSNKKLLGLATNSFVSLSVVPLYFFGILGIIITALSLILGLSIIIEQLILDDPLFWNFTGNAMLGILLLFLVGLLLMSQGILSLYMAHLNNQSKQRPLYIIDYSSSIGFKR